MVANPTCTAATCELVGKACVLHAEYSVVRRSNSLPVTWCGCCTPELRSQQLASPTSLAWMGLVCQSNWCLPQSCHTLAESSWLACTLYSAVPGQRRLLSMVWELEHAKFPSLGMTGATPPALLKLERRDSPRISPLPSHRALGKAVQSQSC